MEEGFSQARRDFDREYGIFPIRFDRTTDDEMALSEHIEEFSQRTIFSVITFIVSTLICFSDIKDDDLRI